MPVEQIASLISMLRKNLQIPPKSVAEFRERFTMMMEYAPMIEGVTRTDVYMDGVSGAYFDALHVAQDRVLLYLHGGGYMIGSVDTYATLIARLSHAAQCRALGVEYRLAPEHPFPAGLDDCVKAYRWLLAQGTTPEKIVIGGDSAGGGMTIATLMRIREEGLPMPAGAFCISPWVDMAATGESMETKASADPMIQKMGVLACAHIYLRNVEMDEVLASPIYADLSGLPPLYIQVGTSETLLDDAKRLANRAEECGVAVELEIWEDMIHVWHLFAHVLDEGREAIARIGHFAQSRMESAE